VACVLPRLNRLLGADGRCVDIAVDHGLFGESSFIPGIEDMPAVVRTLVAAAPDAIQLSPGHAALLQDLPAARKPALVLRSDVANVYGSRRARELFSVLAEDVVARAVALDAACVCVNLLLLDGEPELHRECVENVLALRAACDPVGMPLMVEPLAMRVHEGAFATEGDTTTIATLVRQAAELGADVIKADPTDALDEYHRVVQAAGGRPLLVRGGGRASDEEVLRRAVEVVAQGARGVVYGRNVIQHAKPAAMVGALMAIVHEQATAHRALALLDAA